MVRLLKSRVEIEGRVHERLVVAEAAEGPEAWPEDASLTFVGRGLPRVDGPERVSGRAIYTHDVQLPGMLYARVLRSPHPHARVKRLDLSRAQALPGVRAVLSQQNAPSISLEETPPLFGPELRYAGEEVAAVAADDEYIAEDALALIDAEYEVLPFVADVEAALRPGAPPVHPGGNLIGGKPRVYERGDLERGFAEADVVVAGSFQTQTALHNCLETHGTVAAWDGDKLTVWESTQHVYGAREQLAQAFALPLSNVRVICQYMGGGFGSKQSTGTWALIAALLAREAGRPVKLMLTRREENLATGNRQPTIQHLKIGAKRDGRLTAMELTVAAPIGAYGWGAMEIEGPVQTLYACPNLRTEVSSVYTNTGPHSAFRGPGYVEGAFPLETLLDELSDQLGIDPLEVRMKNYATADPTSGNAFSAKHLDECYRQGAEMIGWPSRGQGGEAPGTKRRGLGMASQIWGGGGGPPAYAWVKLNPEGEAEVMIGGQDIGTGTKTAFAQIAAEELDFRLDQVTVRLGDSATGPYAPVSAGSQTLSSVGPAVRQAAADARDQLREIASALLSVPVEQLQVRDGSIYVGDEAASRLTVSAVAHRVVQFTILGKGSRGLNPSDLELRTFGAQFAEVEVDIVTGEVRVLRIVAVHDFGRVINPLGSRSQLEGGVVQALGFALTEERVIDGRYGIVLNPNLEDYKVPTALDTPEIEVAFVNRPDNRASGLGLKGLGEPPLIPTAPAIANAIARATGIRLRSLPLSRDKILEALGALSAATEAAQ